MMPFAPQVDRSGSPFLSDGLARWQGDAAVFNQPEFIIIYDGANNAVPVLTVGGVITLLPQPGDINNYKMLYRHLQEVNITQSNVTLTKHKTRVECRKIKCQGNEYYGIIVTRRSTGTVMWSRREYMNYEQVDLDNPDCNTDCQARVDILVNQINTDPYGFVTATKVTTPLAGGGNSYSIDLEAKIAGVVFDQTGQGFTNPDVLVQASKGSYTAAQMRQWYGTGFLAGVADTKVFTIAEVLIEEIIVTDNLSTSSNSSPHGFRHRRMAFGTIVFDESNSNSLNALNEFKAIVNYEKAASLYHSRLMSTAGNPAVTYPFTIAKTDAGDATAFNTAQTAYAGGSNGVRFIRADYVNGKSYYTTLLKTNTPPTPINSSGDVVEPGSYGADDLPCLNCL